MSYSFSKICDSQRLTKEIQTSAIVTALGYIQTVDSPATTDVFFKATLSEGDEVILNGLVAAHTNTPLLENTVALVSVQSQTTYQSKIITLSNGTVKKLYARNTGLRYPVTAGSNELIYTATYPWVKMTGVECVWCETGDYVDFAVYDTATGSYSGYPNVMLNKFAFTINLPKDYYKRDSKFDADLYPGMVIKMTYYSTSAKTVGINLIMDEVK